MPTPQRLPIVNSDDGAWGAIIRQYLMKEHFNDDTDNAINGQHQNITIKASTGAAGTAPITFNSGTLLGTKAAGAMEFNTDSLYFTITTGTVRKTIAMYDDSSGATGDLYYRNSGGAFTRLGIGSTNQQLTVSGGLPVWQDNKYATVSKTSGYTITSSDTVIFADATSAAVAITLPTASSLSGYKFYIKRIDNVTSNACTVVRTGTDTIDGLISLSLDLQYTAITVVSNGSAWYIL